jgi:hypothetical protein
MVCSWPLRLAGWIATAPFPLMLFIRHLARDTPSNNSSCGKNDESVGFCSHCTASVLFNLVWITLQRLVYFVPLLFHYECVLLPDLSEQSDRSTERSIPSANT